MSQKAKKASWKLDKGMVVYTGVNGGKTEYKLSNITDGEIINQLLYYGLKQKLADSIAGIGKDATDEMKIADMTETYDRLVSGQWNKTVEKGKLITKADFMAQAKENGVPEEMAENMWNLARTKQ